MNLLLAAGAWIKKSVTGTGALLGLAIGLSLYFFGGIVLWLVLVFFFMSSTIIGRLERRYRPDIERIIHKSGTRDWLQVAANGLPAAVFVIIHYISGKSFWLTASYASLAAATADTWASEIGVLSKKKPISLLTFRHVDAGVSGGITLLGTSASAAGALFSALIALSAPQIGILQALFVFIGGNMGSLSDSLLGASLQAKYIDSEQGYITEHSYKNVRVAGFQWMTNDMVNLLSVSIAGTGAFLLSAL